MNYKHVIAFLGKKQLQYHKDEPVPFEWIYSPAGSTWSDEMQDEFLVSEKGEVKTNFNCNFWQEKVCVYKVNATMKPDVGTRRYFTKPNGNNITKSFWISEPSVSQYNFTQADINKMLDFCMKTNSDTEINYRELQDFNRIYGQKAIAEV